MPGLSSRHPTIYFDGECHLCNGFVQYVIRHDPDGKFLFSPLQSEYARTHGFEIPKDPDGTLETVLFEEDGRVYDYSTAVLRIITGLGGWHRIFSVCFVVPKVLRDTVYRWIARRRYGIFGRAETCMVPGEGLEARFLME